MKVNGYYSYTWEYTITTTEPLSVEQIEAISLDLLSVRSPESIINAFTTEPEPD